MQPSNPLYPALNPLPWPNSFPPGTPYTRPTLCPPWVCYWPECLLELWQCLLLCWMEKCEKHLALPTVERLSLTSIAPLIFCMWPHPPLTRGPWEVAYKEIRPKACRHFPTPALKYLSHILSPPLLHWGCSARWVGKLTLSLTGIFWMKIAHFCSCYLTWKLLTTQLSCSKVETLSAGSAASIGKRSGPKKFISACIQIKYCSPIRPSYSEWLSLSESSTACRSAKTITQCNLSLPQLQYVAYVGVEVPALWQSVKSQWSF